MWLPSRARHDCLSGGPVLPTGGLHACMTQAGNAHCSSLVGRQAHTSPFGPMCASLLLSLSAGCLLQHRCHRSGLLQEVIGETNLCVSCGGQNSSPDYRHIASPCEQRLALMIMPHSAPPVRAGGIVQQSCRPLQGGQGIVHGSVPAGASSDTELGAGRSARCVCRLHRLRTSACRSYARPSCCRARPENK